jgi:hypothetical protein
MKGFVRDRFVEFSSSTLQSNGNILSVSEQVFIPAVSHKKIGVVYVFGYSKCTQNPKIIPYPGFRYTLPVPTVRWVHFLYLKPLVCIPFSTGAI